MDPWWFINFHYNNGKTNEDQVIRAMGDFKNKLKLEIYREEIEGLKGKVHSLIPRYL